LLRQAPSSWLSLPLYWHKALPGWWVLSNLTAHDKVPVCCCAKCMREGR
jgi:hypothetical protein